MIIPEVDSPLVIAHTGREFGNMDDRFGDAADVLEARYELYRTVGLRLSQVAVMYPANDGLTVMDLAGQKTFDYDTDAGIRTDAFITPEVEVGLAMNPADCNVIALSDGETLLSVHAGWKGAVKQILERTIDQAVSIYGFDPANAQAYFAPAISSESYTTEQLDPGQTTDAWVPFVHPSQVDGKDVFKVDIPGYLQASLVNAGVDPSRITLPVHDTGADDDYFSYTRFQENPERSPNGRNGFVSVHKG